jgi:replicative superfamily II helicase
LDGCERALLQEEEAANSFHVLVSTPEKLNLLIRNRVVSEKRPLALVVVDEAHNIEDEERGLRVELLLATIKRDCPNANYLLLMPFVPNAKELASWLGAGSGRTISLGTSAWQPNERIVGLFGVEKEASVRAGWQLHFETLITTPKTLHLKGRHKVGGVKPLAIPYSEAKSPTVQAGAMARVFSERGTSIAVAKTIPHCWSLARTVVAGMPVLETISPEIELACRFLAAEVAEDFELVEMLRHGVGVHHAGLSEETRAFIEWLAESGKLRVLCATTTIAQGINFPVASVFLASRSFPYGREMSKRAFWNLAGRAGRVGQDSVGVVGLAGGNDRRATIRYVQEATEDLVSRLVAMLREISDAALLNLTEVIHREQWSDFRSYIAHLYNEAKDLNKTLAEAEQALRNTFGYGTLQTSNQPPDRKRAAALLEAAKAYARELDKHPENASLADATGFDPEGVRTALLEMNKLEQKLKPSDWQPASLFGNQAHSVLPQLVGVMMQIPQIGKSLDEISGGGIDRKHIAALAKDWVNGKSIKDIAEKYFASTNEVTTDDISKACKGIYRALANAGTWGLAALSQMGTSGLDFKTMTAEDRMAVNNLPAMLYHGVNTEAAVLMRINAVPRSIAPKLGDQFAASKQGSSDIHNPRAARNFLRALSTDDWQKAAPPHSKMSGTDYRDVWQLLSGERI